MALVTLQRSPTPSAASSSASNSEVSPGPAPRPEPPRQAWAASAGRLGLRQGSFKGFLACGAAAGRASLGSRTGVTVREAVSECDPCLGVTVQ